MSAARPAAAPRVRPTSSAPIPQPARPVGRAAFFEKQSAAEDTLRLNLSDLPRAEASMDVDGFKPSLLSRLFDLFAPVHKR
jgi:hypothetical protein